MFAISICLRIHYLRFEENAHRVGKARLLLSDSCKIHALLLPRLMRRAYGSRGWLRARRKVGRQVWVEVPWSRQYIFFDAGNGEDAMLEVLLCNSVWHIKKDSSINSKYSLCRLSYYIYDIPTPYREHSLQTCRHRDLVFLPPQNTNLRLWRDIEVYVQVQARHLRSRNAESK